MEVFTMAAVVTVAFVFGVVAIILGLPLVRNLSELLLQMKQDRQVLVERDDATRELRQTVEQLAQRVARVEEGLEFLEQLKPGTGPRQLKGSETQSD
jgi:hypothetical protein